MRSLVGIKKSLKYQVVLQENINEYDQLKKQNASSIFMWLRNVISDSVIFRHLSYSCNFDLTMISALRHNW